MANGGPDQNVMTISPPMCFTCDNAKNLLNAIDVTLGDIERGSSGTHNSLPDSIPLDILSTDPLVSDSDSEGGSDIKRPRYEEMD